MSKLAEFPDLALVREQAATWIARLARGLNDDEQAEFRRWCAHPAHARTLKQMSAMWDELDVMKKLAEVFPDHPGESGDARSAATRRGSWRRPALAASVAALLGIAGFFTWQQLEGAPAHRTAAVAHAAVSYTTAIGEHRNVPLADGSMLAINTDSAVDVLSIDGAARELSLLRGEAHFSVAHDPSRPFRVKVAGRVVQAVGTAFNIRLHDDGDVEVIVTEGRVQLQGDAAASTLDRGQALWIDSEGGSKLSRLPAEALAARLAWRSGMLVFDGETLTAALDEFARYTSARFVITDQPLRRLRIGGYFPAGDTEFLLDALRNSFGLDCQRGADGVIRISPGRSKPGG